MSERTITDDEVLFRRIQPGNTWFEPPDRLTSASFKLRRLEDGQYEEGLSVYRRAIVSAAEVLAKPEAKPGSILAHASAGEVRALRNGVSEPLGLDVLAINDENDPGHAEIRGPEPRKISASASKKLAKLFRVVDM